MKKVTILGDSQTAAIQKGLETLQAEGRSGAGLEISVRPLGAGGHMTTKFFEKSENLIRITEPVFQKRVASLPVDGETEIYGFSGNLHSLRVIRDVDWSGYAPLAIAKDEKVISEALLEMIFAADQRHMLDFLDAIASLGFKTFVVEAPRPFRHNPIFASMRKEVVLFLDRAYRAYVLRELESRNIDVVRIPPHVHDEEGFMLPEFRHPNENDRHHANTKFGAIMARRMLDYLENGPAATG